MPVAPSAKESWRRLKDEAGHVAAYRVAVDDRMSETLADVWSYTSPEIWTALEITGTAAHPTVAVARAIRTADRPAAAASLPGLTPERGQHRPALKALNPPSPDRLEARPDPLPDGLLDRLQWPVDQANLTRV